MSDTIDDTYEVDVVSKIRDDIQYKYNDAYAILKELIQNADDARASELHLVFIESLSDVEHELLQGPLIAVINNAAFTFEHAAAIRQLQGGSKGLDDCKIGKFGLGQKSVFHLCEAFFYVSDLIGDEESVPTNAKRYPRSGILSPWGRTRYASRLSVSNADFSRLRTEVERLLSPEQSRWFALFLPLRLKQHCAESPEEDPGHFAISEVYFDELASEPPQRIFGKRVIHDLPRVMPFLLTLDSILHWRLDQSGELLKQSTVWRVRGQHVDWEEMQVGRLLHSGHINVRFDDTEQTESLVYAGNQMLLDSEELRCIAAEDGWPRFDVQTINGRRRGKAKAKQHVGVLVLQTSGASRFLGFVDTVFLPLGCATHQPTDEPSKVDFEILQHGFFFLDSGRTKVDRLPLSRPADEETTRQRWNRLLTQRGLFPLLLSALEAFAGALSGTVDADVRLTQLTDCIRKSSLFTDEKKRICQDLQWSFRLVGKPFSWSASDCKQPIIELPVPESPLNEAVTWIPEIFSVLEFWASKATITFSDLPRLTLKKASIPEGFLADLLEALDIASLSDCPEKWSYFLKCLTEWKSSFSSQDEKLLIRQVKLYLRTPPLVPDEKAKALLESLSPHLVLPISFELPLSESQAAILDTVWAAAPEVLAAPRKFAGDDAAGKLKSAKVAGVVKAILDCGATLESVYKDAVPTQVAILGSISEDVDNVVLDLLNAVEGVISKEHEKFDELRIWSVSPGTAARRVTLKKLQALALEKRLFQANTEQECVDYLRCLKDEPHLGPALVAKKTVDTLKRHGWDAGISRFNEAGFVEFLKQKPQLSGDNGGRAACALRIARISKGLGLNEPQKAAIRYLLHGSPLDCDIGVPLLLDNSDAWSAFASAVLSAKQQSWRLVSPSIAQFEPPVCRELQICECTPETAISLLDSNTDVQKIDLVALASDAEKLQEILFRWPKAKFELLRRLKLFRRSDDSQLINAVSKVFIQGNLPQEIAGLFENYTFVSDKTGVLALREIVPPQKPIHLLNEALQHENVSQYWKFICTTLETTPIGEATRKALKTVGWLPLVDGTSVSPENCIRTDGLESLVNGLRDGKAKIAHKNRLCPELLTSGAWTQTVERLCPLGVDTIEPIGRALSGLGGYEIGQAILTSVTPFEFQNIFASAPEKLMPVVEVIQTLTSCLKPQNVNCVLRDHVLKPLERQMSQDRYVDVLKYLSDLPHIVAGEDPKDDAFDAYLKEALQVMSADKLILQTKLRNVSGDFVSTDQLTISGLNVDAKNLLDSDQSKILLDAQALSEVIVAGAAAEGPWRSAPDESAIKASPPVLWHELQQWRTNCDIPSDALAALIAVLGNDPGYRELYGQLHSEHTIEEMWSFLSISKALQQSAVRFCLRVDHSEKIQVTNLLGQEFQADASTEPESFFDSMHGMPDSDLGSGGTTIFQLRIRPCNVQKLNTIQKLDIIRKSIEDIRRFIWKCQSPFDTAWGKLTAEDQLELRIAQQEIMRAYSVILETQLAVDRSSGRLLTELSELLHQRYATNKALLGPASSKSSDQRKNEKDTLRGIAKQIRQLLVSDKNTQQGVIREIKERLSSQSYEVASVPFEIFQNADDAVAELKAHCSAQLIANIRPSELLHTFRIDSDTNKCRVAFYHWGRAINQYRFGDNSVARFQRDLEKMLVLQGSGKVHESGVTGHFGLGFKSVFFVTDEPKVFSGWKSHFVVKSGIYPHKLGDEDEDRLRGILQVLESREVPTGTVIELPLQSEQTSSNVLNRFRQYAGYLVLFSRAIRKIDFAGESPVVVERMEHVLAPHVSLVTGIQPNEQRAILFCCDDTLGQVTAGDPGETCARAAILLHINANGLPAVPSCNSGEDPPYFPEIWVTTPATEHRGTGAIVLNADLDVNPGRTRLRDADRNSVRLKQIGGKFGKVLCQFFTATQVHWSEMIAQLCPTGTGFSAQQFWDAFWKICLPIARRPSTDPIRCIVFGEGCGLNQLIQEKAVIPSSLPAPFDQPVKLGDIQQLCAGLLTSSTRWELLSQRMIGKKSVLERLQLVIKPGAVVSDRTSSELSGIGVRESLANAQCLTLADVISKANCDGHAISSALGSAFGQIVAEDIIPPWDGSGDAGNSREVLQSLRFFTDDTSGHLVKVNDALAAEFSTGEEALLAALSPKKFILSACYDKSAVSFLQFCRGPVQLETNKLAERCINADAGQRSAVVQYLARGQQATLLRAYFEKHKDEIQNSWLADESQLTQAMSTLNAYDRLMCLAVLNRRPIQSDYSPITLNRSRIPAEVAFKSIALWWNTNRKTLIEEHDRRVYPAGQMPEITLDPNSRDLKENRAVRHEWLTLMIRGQLFRLGYKDFQHRRFLEEFLESELWRLLVEGLDDPTGWFDALDNYLDNATEKQTYFHWMNQILAYYQLTRWLPDYVSAFSGITRSGVNLAKLTSIVDFTNQRSAHIFGGSTGLDAPPCRKTLGLGAHFILREVLRRRRLQDPQYRTQDVLARMSFVPSASVRKFFREITGDTEFESNKNSELCAKLMYEKAAEFVDDPTFDNCFDIPFRMFTWKEHAKTRAEILGSDFGAAFYSDEDGVDASDEENPSL